MNWWVPCWLSLGGRVTLTTSVLQSIPIYWMSLFKLPAKIIQAFRRIIFHFLWSGLLDCKKIHLASWESLSIPKSWGGWAIKDFKHFNTTLCAKSMWRALNHIGLWGLVIKSKYMCKLPMDIWLWRAISKPGSISQIWRSLLSSLHIIVPDLCWQVGHGNQIFLGRDPILGIPDSELSQALLAKLHEKKLYLLKHIFLQLESSVSGWMSSADLILSRGLAAEWDLFIEQLLLTGISLQYAPNRMIWKANSLSRVVRADLAYVVSLSQSSAPESHRWHSILWRMKIPIKVKYFCWLAINLKILTWDTLQCRGLSEPGRCTFCLCDSESVMHLFGSCPFFKLCGQSLCISLSHLWFWDSTSIAVNFEDWKQRMGLPFEVIGLFLWEFWKAWNVSIFEHIPISQLNIISKFCRSPSLSALVSSRSVSRTPILPLELRAGPIGYFDGAANAGVYGAGMVLIADCQHSFRLHLDLGEGTNTMSKLLGLWGLLCFANLRNISEL